MDKKNTALAQAKELVVGYHKQRDDILFGRMPVGFDVSEFDALPIMSVDIEQPGEEGVDEIILGRSELEPDLFEEEEEHFPLFRSTLAQFEEQESPARIVRIDTDDTYGDFVCESALRELDRRVRELRAALEQHKSDLHGAHTIDIRRWDEVLGAAQSIADLRGAATAQDALRELPKVLVDIPDYAEGAVRCWRDGDAIVCSIRFQAADGAKRVATASARPRVSEDVLHRAASAGLDPVTVLGMLPDLAEAACGRRLLRDTARAALEASTRDDVLGMDEPVVLVSGGSTGAAPVAAMMHVQQRAMAGDRQAQAEVRKLRQSGLSAFVDHATQRLREGRRQKALAQKPSFMKRYALMGMFV